jgi:ectoine hydroxylase-related dioxygenase (phytanoyl-CoA dioxygenase family)
LNYGARVLSDDELNDLRQALDRVMNGESEAQPERIANISAGQSSGNVVTQVVNIWEAEPAFRRHLSHPAIVGMVAQLMGGVDTVRVWHDQVQVKPARVGGPTTWHQDHPYWPVIQPADLVSAWVALEDATLENGCMRMVPRSHKWGAYKGRRHGRQRPKPPGDPITTRPRCPKAKRSKSCPCPSRPAASFSTIA